MIYAFSHSSLRFYWSMDRYWGVSRVIVIPYNVIAYRKTKICGAKIKVKLK